MYRWLIGFWEGSKRVRETPRPPWAWACKRTSTILNGVWYGKLTPTQASNKAAAWGWEPERIEEAIARATQPPSYWSRHAPHDSD